MSVANPAVDVELAPYTTLRVGGPARRLVEVDSTEDLIEAVRSADAEGEPVLVLGGGSNLLVGDDGFAGTVIKINTRGTELDLHSCAGANLLVAAGEPWDDLVEHTITEGWSGLEAMSGIPGLTGATPIQNVGAYGAEVSHTISVVHTYDRQTQQRKRFASADCEFGYRTSRFKAEPGRFVVLSVEFQLPLGELSAPIRYAELARTLGVSVGRRVDSRRVREAVLELRRSKGMVSDAADPDTWSAGSFFTNPILDADAAQRLPASAPRFDQPDGTVKTSAAWLIEHAGFGKGYGQPPAMLSTKHTLALTNRGGAHATQLLTLADCIRTGVRAEFGIELVPEPVLVGCSL